MSKCLRCGANIAFRAVTLADGALCYKCFEELGFDKSDRKYHTMTPYEKIKDGKSVYIARLIDEKAAEYDKDTAAKIGLRFAHYGDEREVNATDEEDQIFDVIRSMVTDPEQLELVRKSDSYVTAVIGEWDLARFKYTDRAKWIIFPNVEAKAQKHYIEDPEDVLSFADLLAESIAHIDKYSNR